MPRQVLSPIDLRTWPERQGITRTQQTAQAIANILQTVGAAEQKRRERQTLDRITRAISGGATTIEAISAAAGQGPEFGTGIPGALQRFGGMFQPSPGGMEQSIKQAIIGGAIQQAFAEPSPLRPISTGEVTSIFDPMTGQITPTEHPSARVPSTTIYTGQALLTEAQRQEMAETDYVNKVGLSASEKNLARKSAEELMKGARKRFWHWGTEDYPQERMIELYKTWRIENTYPEKTEKQRKTLDSIWDGLMGLWKKRGIKLDGDNIIGKNEIEWDPQNPEVIELRKIQKTKPVSKRLIRHMPGSAPLDQNIELEGGTLQTSPDSGIFDRLNFAPVDDYPEPKSEEEFLNTYRHISDKRLRKYYYDKWSEFVYGETKF